MLNTKQIVYSYSFHAHPNSITDAVSSRESAYQNLSRIRSTLCVRTRILLFIAILHVVFLHDEQALQSQLFSRAHILSRLSFFPAAFSVNVHEMSVKRRPHGFGMRDLSARESYEAISRNRLLIQLRTFVTF